MIRQENLEKKCLNVRQHRSLMQLEKLLTTMQRLKKLVEEYAELKQKFNDIMADKDSDKMPLTDIGNRITEIEKQIKENEVTAGLMRAETGIRRF